MPELLPFLVHTDAFFDHALGTSSGSLSPRTKWREMATFQFRLPPIDKQKEMVELFQAIEDAIAATEVSIEAAAQLKESLMDELLVHGVNHTDFQKTRIGSIPVQWQTSKLGDVIIDCRYGTSVACNSHSGKFPVLRIPNIVTENLLVDDLKFADMTEEEVSQAQHWKH